MNLKDQVERRKSSFGDRIFSYLIALFELECESRLLLILSFNIIIGYDLVDDINERFFFFNGGC